MPPQRSDPPEGDTRTSGFSEDERNELKALIAEAVGSAKPPAAPAAPTGPAAKSDDEWDAMSDRQRESWVRQLVDFRLDELARDDEQRQLAAKVDALSKPPEPEPEKPPSVVSKLQKFLWGDQQEQK